jgi:Cu/Ag efflux protein CusF
MIMKMTMTSRLRGFLAAVLTASAAFRSSADDAPSAMGSEPATTPEKSRTGTVISVDPKEHTLSLKEWTTWRKHFNLGDTCTYVLLDNAHSTINDLRPGEKVTVSYRNAHGVLIAGRVTQIPMQLEGTVEAINPADHHLTMHWRTWNRQLQLADNCNVVLLHQTPGPLSAIRPGDHVTVTYELPDGVPTAREIAQTSLEFTGTLTAIDLEEKTVKAKAAFDSRKFNVADDCTVVINSRTDGRLSDLKPNDRLSFSYDQINGVNVVNRIGVLDHQANPVAYGPTPPIY